MQHRPFVIGDDPSVADISMLGYLCFPSDESGIDLAEGYPAISAWIGRMTELPGWQAPYDLLPGKRLQRYG